MSKKPEKRDISDNALAAIVVVAITIILIVAVIYDVKCNSDGNCRKAASPVWATTSK